MSARPLILAPPPGEVARARTNLAALEALDRLDSEGGDPTPDELTALGQWSGWGTMSRALDRRVREEPWRSMGQRIRHLLPEQVAEEAQQATYNSFYTPTSIARLMWDTAARLGFPGGQVLEPGCGHGAIMAAVPEGLDVELTGIERDPTTARIAKLLNPQARIVHRRLEKVSLPPGSFDLVIGNVPFAEVSPHDPNAPVKLSLHNYFIWRALDAVRPGGLVIVLTSRYTLDAEDVTHRWLFHETADLVGAVRLPTGWEREYGSDVVADLLVFRRRPADQETPEAEPDWLRTYEWRARYWDSEARKYRDPITINRYWDRYPALVAGQMAERKGSKYGMTLSVNLPTGHTVDSAIEAAADTAISLARLREQCWEASEAPAVDLSLEMLTDGRGRPEGSFHVETDGTVVQIERGRPVPVRRCAAELTALIGIRDATLRLLEAEADPESQDADAERAEVGRLYDDYVFRHGFLNRSKVILGPEDPETGEPTIVRRRPTVMHQFRQDPAYALVLSIEVYDDEKGARKAPMLLGRVNRRPMRKQHADDPTEAVALCLDEHGELVTETLARLLGISRLEVARTLGDLAFHEPGTYKLIPADQYLSGNVRRKLIEASEARKRDNSMARNVAALEAVIPEDIPWQDIHVRLGAPWVTTADIKLFVEETIGPVRSVHHQPVLATWQVEATSWQRGTAEATATWGTARQGFDAYALVQYALNGQTPVPKDEVEVPGPDGKFVKKWVKNVEDTLACDAKVKALQERFAAWLWEDPKRTEFYVRHYNDLFNSTVIRKFNGGHLTFRGLAGHIKPHPHQLDMTFRGISTEASLCGHAVGAGKTGTIALTARKLRELGLANKPLAVVPNHLLEQTAREMLQWFPDAKILMASSEDITAEKRRLFAARAALGDWDLIVMTHTAFTALAMAPEVEAAYLREQIARFRQAMMDADDENDRSLKSIEKQVSKMESRLKELLAIRRDEGIYFGQLGIDFVFVDESHYFKRLAFACRTEGFSLGYSKRASDLHMKLWWLRQRSKSRRLGMLLSGTPVSNTLAELFVLQTYLQPDRLEELGIDAFDAWAGNFVEFQTNVEVAPEGTFRLYTRPSQFMNVPDLRRLFAEVAEILPSDKLQLERPTIIADTVVIPLPAELVPFIKLLSKRADDIRGGLKDKREDNMLLVCTDGRKAALDPWLVGIETTSPGKVESVVERTLRIWREHGGATSESEQPEKLWWETPEPEPEAVERMVGFLRPMQNDLFEWVELQESALRLEAQREADRLAARAKERQAVEARKDSILQVVFCDLGTPKAGKQRGDRRNDQVYGRVRDGLVAGGMDRRRIRFVHDAQTPSQKEALFEDCRRGAVDVLLGSTDKLGVGVNIQRRLKAIHHLDPPWRPSDIEQREGRGHRPGNRHKELIVIRYVVEGSFDGYMWQALDRKAKFIAQVLTGDLSARIVPDIGAIVLSYTEVKALATGNQELMALAEVEGQLARLRTLLTVHRREVRRLEYEAEDSRKMAESRANNAEALEAIAHAARYGEPDLLRPGQPRASGRNDIGQALADALQEAVDSGDDVRVGHYRGARITAHAKLVFKAWKLSLSVTPTYIHDGRTFQVGQTHLAKGQVWRLAQEVDDLIDGAAEEARRAREDVLRIQRHAAGALQQSRAPWEHDKAFQEALDRKAEIEGSMRKAASAPAQPGEAAA
jgi:N12 class adenine-specific DNA methylase